MQWKHDRKRRFARFLLAAGLTAGALGGLPAVSDARDCGPVPSRARFLRQVEGPAPISAFERPGISQREKTKFDRLGAVLTARGGKSREGAYKRWQEATPEDRRRLEQRMEQWNRMSPQERDAYRQRYRQYRRLSPEEQRRLQRDLDRWEQLSPQQRDSIRRKFND